MTAHELLELSAKAIGLELGPDSPWRTYYPDSGFEWWNEDGRARLKSWNPLNDDGDALRLAVKLNLKVECMTGQSEARTFDSRFAGCVDHSLVEQYPKRPFNPDPFAATRLAIVMTAAAIQLGGEAL